MTRDQLKIRTQQAIDAIRVLKDMDYGWSEMEKMLYEILIELDDSDWHTGTPTRNGLYVVLTKVSMEGVSSSEGTYILDYWDGYSFQYLRRKAMVYLEPDTYGWVAWQRIELYKEATE